MPNKKARPANERQKENKCFGHFIMRIIHSATMFYPFSGPAGLLLPLCRRFRASTPLT